MTSPAPYLVPGPVVLVPGNLAAAIAAALRVGLREIERRDALKFPIEAYDLLAALQVVAALHLDKVRCGATDKSGPSASVELMDRDEVGQAEAGRLLGISRQAVAGRISRGTLPARRTASGRLLIRRDNLEVG